MRSPNTPRVVALLSLIALLAGCASSGAPYAGGSLREDEFNARMASQGTEYYCASGDCDTAPRLIRGRVPEFPAVAVLERRGGFASVAFVIAKDGSTRDIEVLRASEPVFGEVSKRAVKLWRFEPATKDGEPVDLRVIQQFPFTIR
jgi:TonB family protein